MKYETGTRFIDPHTNIIYEITSFAEGVYKAEPASLLDNQIDDDSAIFVDEVDMPLPMYDDYYLGEMATVCSSAKPAMSIHVNPDPNRIGNPYFKVYDSELPRKNDTRICRLHFLDSGMEYHKDSFKDWIISSKDIRNIKSFLSEKHELTQKYSNWQMAKFLWNLEYRFFPQRDIDKYMSGQFDDQFKDHPSYVPSTAEIPDTWEYNPPKGKNKRKLT